MFVEFNHIAPPYFQIVLIAVLALILGSFTTLITFRIRFSADDSQTNKTGRKIVFSRSKCDNCGIVLGIKNLIPLFSWIGQRGKCSSCQHKISLRYPLIEFIFLYCFLTVYLVLGRELSPKMLIYFFIISTLIAMSVFDIEQYFIPDSLQYFLAFLAILLVMVIGKNDWLMRLEAAILYLGFGVVIYALFYAIVGIEGLGVDDLKLFFIAGFLLGIDNFVAFIFLSGFLGIIFGSIWQRFKKDDTFPFAPAICLAIFSVLLFAVKLDLAEIFESILFLQTF